MSSLGQIRNALVISRFAENDLPLPGVPKIRPLGFFNSFRSRGRRIIVDPPHARGGRPRF